PLSDVPELAVARGQVNALEILRLTGGNLGTSDQRDNHNVVDEDVVHLQNDLFALIQIGGAAQLITQLVVFRIGVAAVVVTTPLVGLGSDLDRGPTTEVVGRVGLLVVVGVHLDVVEEVAEGIGVTSVAREEDASV